MSRIERELDETKKLEQEVRDNLQAIGPNHPLYAPLMEELDTLKANIQTIENNLKN